MKFGKNAYDELRMKFGVWNRERKEKAAEKRAVKAQQPVQQGAPLAWCYLLTAVGVAALIGSTWMLLVFVAGSVGHVDWYWQYAASEAGVSEDSWAFTSQIHLLVGVGLFLFCLSIAMFNATWLEARRHLSGLIKNVVTGIGVAVGLFMISGAIVVQQRGTDARARDEVVAAQTAAASAGSIQEQIGAIDSRLAQMRDRGRNNEYAATAANVGAEAYRAQYMNPQVLAREEPARRRIIERALGAAVAADALEAQRMTLAGQLGAARVETVEAEAVAVRADGFMAAPVAFLEDARKPITAVLGELLALTAFSFALAAWMSRQPYAVPRERSGWATDAEQIEDFSDQPKGKPSSMVPPREVVTDAETGEELVKVRPREYWRKRKGQRQKMDVQPEIPPDEVGVEYDGAHRQAMSGAMVEERESASDSQDVVERETEENADASNSDTTGHNEQGDEPGPVLNVQPEPPEPTLTEEEQAELNQSLAALSELEPTPEPEQVEEAVAVDATPTTLAVEESLPADEQEPVEAADHADTAPQDEPQDEDDRVAPRALLEPAK